MSRFARPLLALALVCGSPVAAIADDDPNYVVYRATASFETVLDGLRIAIEERGLYINNVMDLGGMLERTGKDLGAGEPIYAQARSVEFCSAVLSREMTAENPARIVNCPFIISVYQRAGDLETTYVAHRGFPSEELESSPIMTKVADMLVDLSEAAIAW